MPRLWIFNLTSLLIAAAVFVLLLWRHFNAVLLVPAGGLAYMLCPMPSTCSHIERRPNVRRVLAGKI